MSDPRVTVELLARTDLSVKAVLTEAWGKQWQDVINDCGFGTVTLANDDPDLSLVEYGDYLRFSLDGVHRFMSIVEQQDKTSIAAAEEVDENTVISGRGTLAIFEDATVWPDLYIDTLPFGDARIFNHGSFYAITTTAGGGYQAITGAYDWGPWTAAGAYFTGLPTDFPDTTAHWIGPQAPVGTDNPPGDWYVKYILVGITDGLYKLFVSGDDAVDIYFDDVPIHKSEASAGRTIELPLYLDSNVHDLSIKITNRTGGGPNPTGVIWSLIEVLSDGTLGAIYAQSDVIDPLGYFIDYPPTEPGLTPGDIFTLLVDAAQGSTGDARDFHLNVVLDFDLTDDSDGTPWAEEIQPSFPIGTDLLTVLKQLAETYFVPRMSATDLTLSLHQSLGSASGVVYSPAVNIVDLKHSGRF